MKRNVNKLVLAVVVAAVLPVVASAVPQPLHVANTTVGNQAWSGVGFTFDVTVPYITVQQLGIYDSGADGIIGDNTLLTTVLFDAQQNIVATQTFTALAPGTFDAASNYLFKPIDPIKLDVGQYTLVGYGWNEANYEHNTAHGGAGPDFNGDGILFVRSVWGLNPGVDPAPTWPMSAGALGIDYFDGPNMIYEVPTPGAILLGTLGLSLVGYLRRRRAM